MSLKTRINDVVTRIADEFKVVKASVYTKSQALEIFERKLLTTNWIDIPHNLPDVYTNVVLRYKITKGRYTLDFSWENAGSDPVHQKTNFVIATIPGLNSELLKTIFLEDYSVPVNVNNGNKCLRQLRLESSGGVGEDVFLVSAYTQSVISGGATATGWLRATLPLAELIDSVINPEDVQFPQLIQKERLLVDYTYSGNTVWQPTAYNPTTGVFTIPNHRLTFNTYLVGATRTANPIELPSPMFGTSIADVIVTEVVDSNNIRLSYAPASIPDITKVWFETHTHLLDVYFKKPLTSFRVELTGLLNNSLLAPAFELPLDIVGGPIYSNGKPNNNAVFVSYGKIYWEFRRTDPKIIEVTLTAIIKQFTQSSGNYSTAKGIALNNTTFSQNLLALQNPRNGLNVKIYELL